MAQASMKPIKVFRSRGISASVFANHAKSDGRDIVFHKVSLQRTFKDGDEWKTTTSFGRDDLPIARLLLGERQAENYLPRGRLGRMSISYDGSFSERMIRLLISFISCFGTMTPVG